MASRDSQWERIALPIQSGQTANDSSYYDRQLDKFETSTKNFFTKNAKAFRKICLFIVSQCNMYV